MEKIGRYLSLFIFLASVWPTVETNPSRQQLANLVAKSRNLLVIARHSQEREVRGQVLPPLSVMKLLFFFFPAPYCF